MTKDYIVHKAIELEKVAKRDRPFVDALIEQGGYELYAKYDGCSGLLFFDGTGTFTGAYSRTGEIAHCLVDCGKEIAALRHDEIVARNGVVVIGEAWKPGKGMFSKISGDFRRHQPDPDMLFIIFDIIDADCFEAGFDPEGWSDRIERLGAPYGTPADEDLEMAAEEPWTSGGPRIFYAEKFPFTTYAAAQEKCNELVALGGFDGAVLRKKVGAWVKGHNGNDGACIKIKQQLSFDLRVKEVNVVKGEKTGRDVYKLVVDFGGRDLGVGSGVPHNASEVPNVGDIVEVVAMDYSKDNLLREPRYKGIRTDKTEPDTISIPEGVAS